MPLSFCFVHVAMGQEAGKLAWPRPTGGYRTIMRRRYRRRHAYASFRPSLNSQDRDERQQDCEGSNLENVQTGSSLCMCISLCMCHLIVNWDPWGWRGKAHREM